MAQSAVDKIPPGPKLDALTAEKVSGLGSKKNKNSFWLLK
jgi:hypothetical protein